MLKKILIIVVAVVVVVAAVSITVTAGNFFPGAATSRLRSATIARLR